MAFFTEQGQAACMRYQKKWREANPEKVLQQRIRAAGKLLTRHGYTVKEPQPNQTSAAGGNGDA